MNVIGRRILNLGGFLKDAVPSTVRSVATRASTHSGSVNISKLMVPPSSVDFRSTSAVNISASQIVTSRPQILDRPIPLNSRYRIDLPVVRPNISYEDIAPTIEIEEPVSPNMEEKHAVRMIVIRRRKMRVHKLKKLRKRMKYVWQKQKLRRRALKEKAFQTELLAKLKEANKFDPAVYVKEKIAKSNEVLVPKLWHGKKLPEFIIKDLIVLKNKKRQAYLDRKERRKNMNVNAADYK